MSEQTPGTNALPLIPIIIEPVADYIQLGRTIIANHHQEFLQAIGWGMQAYVDNDSRESQLCTDRILDLLIEAFEDTELTHEWRLGFICGYMAGLLNPELTGEGYSGTPLALLIHKCSTLYPIQS
ncbi:hypothetical protein EPA93_46920 [Ktedonosporobacter rubrisoli]|uniref:Uncharacterized protein n=1 Tax=Ktedonosporobacter rubrisoli TaxID=2509675 RepID=A0A4P6K4E7_KTERU|nr:hypothetical protein [Ktedonosporobacter rubrisoli]QBD83099.1 hypothetical protein EPA93_46920 [Ktedonosporobacter rubrisoli]